MPEEPSEYQESRDLTITRVLRASRTALWREWAEPDLLKQWWCPLPWTTEVIALDLQAGGAFHTCMHGPDGTSHESRGCFLEVVPLKRLVFTNLLLPGGRPTNTDLGFTAVITLVDEEGGCRYTVRVMHPTSAVRERHEQMGFLQGWNAVITQLDALAFELR